MYNPDISPPRRALIVKTKDVEKKTVIIKERAFLNP